MLHVDPANAAAGATPADSPAAEPASPRDLIERQLQVLSRLTDLAMQIAEAAGKRAVDEAAAPAGPATAHQADPALVFTRVARAVRMTIALQSQLLENLADLEKAEVKAEADRTDARRYRIKRIVERIIEAEPYRAEPVWQTSHKVRERLKDRDDLGAMLGRPIREVVAHICGELGLSPDWSAWADEPWATEAAPCGTEGSPRGAFSAPAPASPGDGTPTPWAPRGASP